MGEVVYKLNAEEGKLVDAMMRVVDKQKKVEDGFRKGAKASKRMEGSVSRMGRSANRELGSMITRWVSIGATVALARKAIQILSEDLKRLDEQNKLTTVSLTQRIASAGDLANQGKIKQFFATDLKGTGVGMHQAGEVYGSVRGAMPNSALSRVLSISLQAARSKRAGFDPVAFGEKLGEIAKLTPGKSPDDVADLATFVEQLQGRHGKRIRRGGWKIAQQWKAAGLGTAEKGIGWMLASVEAEQGSEAFQQLVQKLTEQRELKPLPLGICVTGAQRKERAFWGADAPGRLKIIQGDRKLRGKIFGTQAAGIEAMISRDVGGLIKKAKAAEETNLFSQSAVTALADEQFAREMAIMEEEAGAERVEYYRGAPLAGKRYWEARQRRVGVNPIWRSFTSGTAQAAAAFGAEPGKDDLSAAAEDMRKAASKQLEAADRLKDSCTQLQTITERIPNVNAHVEE